MSKPKAYDPQVGYQYQILTRNRSYSREWEHCDYAEDRADRKSLLENCRFQYGPGYDFKTIRQPRQYWPKKGE